MPTLVQNILIGKVWMDEAAKTETCKCDETTLRVVCLSSSVECSLLVESQVSLYSALFWNVLGHMLVQ